MSLLASGGGSVRLRAQIPMHCKAPASPTPPPRPRAFEAAGATPSHPSWRARPVYRERSNLATDGLIFVCRCAATVRYSLSNIEFSRALPDDSPRVYLSTAKYARRAPAYVRDVPADNRPQIAIPCGDMSSLRAAHFAMPLGQRGW